MNRTLCTIIAALACAALVYADGEKFADNNTSNSQVQLRETGAKGQDATFDKSFDAATLATPYLGVAGRPQTHGRGGDPCDGALYGHTGDQQNGISSLRRVDGSLTRWGADNFSFGSATTVTGAVITQLQAPTTVFTGTVDLAIWTDTGAGPGAVVYSWTDVPATSTPTGNAPYGYTEVWLEAAIPGGSVVLPAGNYFFGMRPINNDVNNSFWETANYGAPVDGDGYYDQGTGTWVALATIFGVPSDLAFCLLGPQYGACCDDATGNCQENVLNSDCVGELKRFIAGGTCADFDPPCGDPPGACCYDDGTPCAIMTQSECEGGAICLGDVDCDGDVDFDDIDPFVDALGGQHTSCSAVNADMDQDGDVDFDDIDIFVDALGGTPNCYNPPARAAYWAGPYTTCAVCPCIVVCQGTPEGEPMCGPDYVDATNGGCNSTPNVFGSIACGETICGKSGTYLFGTSNYRDTDWFEIITTTDYIFTWTVRAEFPVLIFVINGGSGNCADYSIIGSDTAGVCEDAVYTTNCLPAGRYWFWVGPQVFDGIPCDADYEATLTCEPCVPPQCADFTIPSIPYSTTGSTVGMGNDWDYACPYTGSTSPDVVYQYTPTANVEVDIDLCYSLYDTKVYVYQDVCGGTPIACNDDYYFGAPCYVYSSFLPCVPMNVGHTYYIVVDGYGGDSGTYQLDITECTPCVVECQGTPEGEPECYDNYVDTFNGGCNSSPFVFSPIACGQTICGKAGTYLFGSSNYRDTDWYAITTTTAYNFTWSVTAEFDLLIFIISGGSGNCVDYTIYGSATAAPCVTASLTTTECMPPGLYWFWAGPSVFSGIPCDKDYEAVLTCTPCQLPAGACCLGGYNQCVEVPEAECIGQGGVFTAVGVPCAAGPCQGGACCIDEACTYYYGDPNAPTNCANQGGEWKGYGTQCDPNPCTSPAGDTCQDASVIGSLPFYATGDTCGATNNYDYACPYTGSTSPDVVYSFSPAADIQITVDMCESGYDTKVYIYQDVCTGTPIACNDDFCSDSQGNPYRSYLNCVQLLGGHTYYIVVDGYGGDCGTYDLIVEECSPCVIDCTGTPEGEPDCYDGYVDNYNGGCNSTPFIFQPIACGTTVCGKSGTFLMGASNYRDTDWFEIITSQTYTFTWTVTAEFPVLIFVINGGTGNCSDYAILGSATANPCAPASLTFAGQPAGRYWFWAGPSVFSGIPCGVDYEGVLTCQ